VGSKVLGGRGSPRHTEPPTPPPDARGHQLIGRLDPYAGSAGTTERRTQRRNGGASDARGSSGEPRWGGGRRSGGRAPAAAGAGPEAAFGSGVCREGGETRGHWSRGRDPRTTGTELRTINHWRDMTSDGKYQKNLWEEEGDTKLPSNASASDASFLPPSFHVESCRSNK